MSIDWNDERAVGLKCIFEGSPTVQPKSVGLFSHMAGDWFTDTHSNHWHTCRLVQGDKTPYDGKGQPVPDGVNIVMFIGNIRQVTMMSQYVDWRWNGHTHYEVQEQPEQPLHIKTDSTKQIPLQLVEELLACLEKCNYDPTDIDVDVIYKLALKLKELK